MVQPTQKIETPQLIFLNNIISKKIKTKRRLEIYIKS